MGACNSIRSFNPKLKCHEKKKGIMSQRQRKMFKDNEQPKLKPKSPISISSGRSDSSIITNKKSLDKSTLPSTRRSSLNNPSRKVSLIQKSKFCPSSSEELKICVTTQYLIDELHDVPTNKYRLISKIGEGGFGSVFHAKNLINQSEVVMKKIVKSQDKIIDDLDISNEINILKQLDHPNIFKVYECYNTQSAYFIIGEYCSKGELFKHVKTSFSEHQLAVMFYQILSGLNYLHKNRIIHRDIKLENILISDTEIDSQTGEELFWIKLIDFGCAKFFNKKKNEKTVIGTSYYMAPEVLRKKYTEKCDIWSAGVVLYMLITGSAPFNGKDDDEIADAIKRGKYNKCHSRLWKASPEVKDLISKLLDVNEYKRISAEEALSHPWFTKFNGRYLIDTLPRQFFDKSMDNLTNYVLSSKFQQVVLAYLCHNLPSTEETKNIAKLFFKLNTSNTGHLAKEELLIGLTDYIGEFEANEMIDDVFVSLDGDNNGYVEYEEFLRACLDKKTILNEELIQYSFMFFDRDNTNKISLEEIKEMFCENNKPKHIDIICANIIDNYDENKDGVIDYLEFKKMLSNSFIS